MPTHLLEGQKAPAFTATDQDGDTVTLSRLKGKKVVLYFYPEDDTPACTVQACNLRDHFDEMQQQGYTVIGVSPDSPEKHRRFRMKYRLPFTLLSDPQHRIINRYGVWGEKTLYGRTYMGLHRTTFVINEKGVIEKIFLRPRNKMHAAEIMQ